MMLFHSITRYRGVASRTMTRRSIAGLVTAALAALLSPIALPLQHAAAAPCPDAEVVFARGTQEWPGPGLGLTGISFTESLRLQAPGKTIGEYAVNYPASGDFNNPVPLAGTVLDGVRDAQNRLKWMAANCGNTKLILGGYSQGAVVAGLATEAGVPAGVPSQYSSYFPPPLPRDVASKVAAVVLIAKPSERFMRDVGAPPIIVGPDFVGKTIDYCIPGDNICDGAPAGQPNALHVLYSANGMAWAGANYAAGRI